MPQSTDNFASASVPVRVPMRLTWIVKVRLSVCWFAA